MPNLPPAESLTFICCVESGPLETMTLLLAESLRKWGGAFASCPVVAVTPRFGPPLSRATRRGLEQLGVQHWRVRGRNKHAWFGFLNKPCALEVVEERVATPLLAWLDGDILVVREPTEFALRDDEDFAACAFDRNIGSTGPEDPFDRYWQQVAAVFGMDLDSLPWVVTEQEQTRIRLYWNSGVFVWRRAVGFARHYLETCRRLLESRVASAEAGIFFTDQVALGLTMVQMGLRWRALSYEYNYALGSKIAELYDAAKFRQARLWHYHDALWPHSWERTLAWAEQERPDVHSWLRQHGLLRNAAPWPHRALGKWLRFLRERKVRAYQAGCQRY
jgi:hypothetical protein